MLAALPGGISVAEPELLRVPERMLVFGVGPTCYGIDVDAIHEIMPAGDIHLVPGAPQGVAGLAGFRAKSVPVFDLFWKFDVDDAGGEFANLLVVDCHGSQVALRVGPVHEVAAIPRSAFQVFRAPGRGEGLAYLNAAIRWDERLVLWIDAERLVPEGIRRVAV
jgi:chemotaxis signal transduction protein